MTEAQRNTKEKFDRPSSTHQLLLRLDLAMEVIEGLDELGVEDRSQLEALLEHLEQQIAESD